MSKAGNCFGTGRYQLFVITVLMSAMVGFAFVEVGVIFYIMTPAYKC